jgi:hypothetical protein
VSFVGHVLFLLFNIAIQHLITIESGKCSPGLEMYLVFLSFFIRSSFLMEQAILFFVMLKISCVVARYERLLYVQEVPLFC